MGLSASQARFLAVTSRKASCEFRSMELAEQKLSIARELQAATEEYQDAIEATMLVWDADPVNYPGEFRYGLTYDLLMTPSDANKYLPYLVSRQDGKIALEKNMAEAACGITQKGNDQIFNYVQNEDGTYSSDGGLIYNGRVVYKGDDDYDEAREECFKKFIVAMKENKAMSGTAADAILSSKYANKLRLDAGVGGELVGKEVANVMNMTNLMSYIDYIVINSASGFFSTNSDEYKLAERLVFDMDAHDHFDSAEEKRNEQGYPGVGYQGDSLGQLRANLSCGLDQMWSKDYGASGILINGEYCNERTFFDPATNNVSNDLNSSTRSFTLSDLLNEDVTLLVTGQQNYSPILEIMDRAIKDVGDFKNWNLLNEEVDIWYDKIRKMAKDANPDNAGNYPSYEDLVSWAADDDTDPKHSMAKSALAMLNFFDKLAKSMYSLFMPNINEEGVLIPKAAQNSFVQALNNVVMRMRNMDGHNGTNVESNYYTMSDKVGHNQESYAKAAVNMADNYNCWVKNGNSWALSFSNLTEGFMSEFIDGLEDNANNCLITKNANTSNYITDDGGHLYTVNTLDKDDPGLWEQEFYSVIFNNLCTQGFYQNDQLEEKNYLEGALKNGNLFILSKSADNYYYQTRYNQVYGDHVSTEIDQTAVTIAERQYSYIKSKLSMKEERIEVEQKNVDAELNALTNEYNTIQTLIKNNINSTFKMFQSS